MFCKAVKISAFFQVYNCFDIIELSLILLYMPYIVQIILLTPFL